MKTVIHDTLFDKVEKLNINFGWYKIPTLYLEMRWYITNKVKGYLRKYPSSYFLSYITETQDDVLVTIFVKKLHREFNFIWGIRAIFLIHEITPTIKILVHLQSEFHREWDNNFKKQTKRIKTKNDNNIKTV